MRLALLWPLWEWSRGVDVVEGGICGGGGTTSTRGRPRDVALDAPPPRGGLLPMVPLLPARACGVENDVAVADHDRSGHACSL